MATAMPFNVLEIPVPRTLKQREFKERIAYTEESTDEELRQRFRFGPESIRFIVNLIRTDIERPTARNQSLTCEIQLLIALRFFASGSFLQVVGDSFGVDKSTVSRAVSEVARALCARQADFIKWPVTAEEKRKIKRGFYDMAGFPGVIGCIDGTHIRIQAPTVNEPDFVNRKNYHSINTQAICDDEGRFTNIVARWPGATHDSHILRTYQLTDHLDHAHHSLEDGLLLGDSGYGLKPYLMTPFPQPNGPKQRKYNKAHRTTRCTIERTFGRWKRRFHVLHSEIRMNPEKVRSIIGACAVLHNLAIQLGEPDVGGEMDGEEAQLVIFDGQQNDGRANRDFIVQTYF